MACAAAAHCALTKSIQWLVLALSLVYYVQMHASYTLSNYCIITLSSLLHPAADVL
jgi:hypothetical protein